MAAWSGLFKNTIYETAAAGLGCEEELNGDRFTHAQL